MDKNQKIKRTLLWVTLLVLTVTSCDKKSSGPFEMKSDFVKEIVYTPTLNISGNLRPLQERDLKFSKAGRVVELRVKEKSQIRKGDILAVLNHAQEEYELEKALADYKEMELKGNRIKIELMKSQLELCRYNLDQTQLYAPFSGEVASISFKNGMSVGMEKHTIRVIDRSSLISYVDVDELDAPLLKIGQKVVFLFDSDTEITAVGRVINIPIEARLNEKKIAVLKIKLQLDEPPKEILPGYSFSAAIELAKAEKIIVIAKEAVFYDEGKTYVNRKDIESGIESRIEIEVVNLDYRYVKVISGLKVGDCISYLDPLLQNSKEAESGENFFF